MTIQYKNLDNKTRSYMLQEMELDETQGKLYMSKRFNEKGIKFFPGLLREAILKYDDRWLAQEMNNKNCFNSHEQRRNRQGEISVVKIPINTSEMFAEGEFN
ncbi:MAG: hypothetical protein LWX83_03815, partial [Anaerolineae bacterium]|nr:hypothetical protein [Anaerolineae bacterium]